MFNIQDIISNISKYNGLARSSHFQVIIPTVHIDSKYDVKDLSLFADKAVVPGCSFQTTELRYTGYGHTEKRPYQVMVNEAEIGFLVDNKDFVRGFFNDWIFKINDFNSDSDKHLYSYPDEYTTDITITQYDSSGKEINKVKLIRAWPMTISTSNLDWATQNEIERLTVTFSYDYWKKE